MKNRIEHPRHLHILLFVLLFLALAAISKSPQIISADVSTTSTIQVGNGPNGIAFDPLNGNLYLANYETGTVSVINGTTNSVVATVNLNIPRSPWEVAVNPSNGYVYVTDTDSGTVSIIDGQNNSLMATVTVEEDDDHINGIVFDSYNQEMYVVEVVADSVVGINNSSIAAEVGLGSTLDSWAVAYDPVDEGLYVTNMGSDSVSLVNGALLDDAGQALK